MNDHKRKNVEKDDRIKVLVETIDDLNQYITILLDDVALMNDLKLDSQVSDKKAEDISYIVIN